MSTHKRWASVYITTTLIVFVLFYIAAVTVGQSLGLNSTGEIPNGSFPTEVVK